MELNTDNLEEILKSTHSKDFNQYVDTNSESIIDMSNDFSQEIRTYITRSSISQRELFKRADISESYGYKLISGEKKTRKRDVILRLTIILQLSLDETQRLLRKYGLPELYAKMKRDALLMISINEKLSITDTNKLLISHDFEPLESPIGD